MIALLILIYGSFLWLVFGQFRLLPLNKWTGLVPALSITHRLWHTEPASLP